MILGRDHTRELRRLDEQEEGGEAFGLRVVACGIGSHSMILVPIKGTLLPVARRARTAAMMAISIASLQRSKVEESITATRFRCVTHQTIAVFKM
jgi:hypothetical protein